MLRRLIADLKESPATTTLGAAWVLVFVLMVLGRLQQTPTPSLSQLFVGTVSSAHRYGDLTLKELFHGEPWRAITCTFIHYNILHIGLNLYGLYQLGGLVESWYGAGQFLAIYVLIGGGGNLISGLLRRLVGSNPEMHSGGGSTVVLGLVALCAVVGWRSRTRIGDYLRRQMVGILLFTAILGMALPIIDNWGHAGGAIVGAALGFAHRQLIGKAQGRPALIAGALGLIVLIASGAAQIRENRIEDAVRRQQLAESGARLKLADQMLVGLGQIEAFYRVARQRSAFERSAFISKSMLPAIRASTGEGGRRGFAFAALPERAMRADLDHCLAMLDTIERELRPPAAEADYRVLKTILASCLDTPPTASSWARFRRHWQAVARVGRRNRAVARSRVDTLSHGGRVTP